MSSRNRKKKIAKGVERISLTTCEPIGNTIGSSISNNRIGLTTCCSDGVSFFLRSFKTLTHIQPTIWHQLMIDASIIDRGHKRSAIFFYFVELLFRIALEGI
jgi:hypothetical protein